MQISRLRSALVDLYVTEDEELIAEPVCGSKLDEEDSALLIEWARRVGYERIWLPDNVVNLEADPDDVGLAKVNCRTCGAHWEDSSPDFWLKVREKGFFPASCPACGDSLPEWTVQDEHEREAQEQQISS